MKTLTLPSILLAGLLLSSTGFAQLYRSDTGLGSALIVPYWTVAAGNDSLIGVSNDFGPATALKLRVLGEGGEVLAHFNLYLNPRSQWGAALTRIDGQTLLLPSDVGCLLPAPSASHNGRPAIALDAPRGTIEIIEMGRVGEDSELRDNDWRWLGCDALADAFEEGPWADDPNVGLEPPSQRISAQATLINVPAGGMNTVPATAIGRFSDIAQHTAPASELPDLAHAFDSGSENGGVRSLVCVEGNCRVNEWTEPLEALAAVLMVSTLTVGYSIDPGLAAEFEWILHGPLKRYGNMGLTPEMVINVASSDGQPRILPGSVIPVCPCGDPLLPNFSTLQSLSFNAFRDGASLNQTIDSSILGHGGQVFRSIALGARGEEDAPFIDGMAGIFLFPGYLTAEDGTQFLGRPVVSFAIQQFSNGTLTDDQGQNVLSNYRRTELPRRTMQLQQAN